MEALAALLIVSAVTSAAETPYPVEADAHDADFDRLISSLRIYPPSDQTDVSDSAEKSGNTLGQ